MLDTLKNHGKRWTEEEEERLKELRQRIGDWDKISDKIGRSPRACSDRYRKLTGSTRIWTDKSADRIKINDHMGFQRSFGKTQTCSYCGSPTRGEYGLSISKDILTGWPSYRSRAKYNVWIHARCLKGFLKTVEKAIKEHEEKLRSEIANELAEELSGESNNSFLEVKKRHSFLEERDGKPER